MDSNGTSKKINYYNIIHWKNPVTTIVFLVLINLGLAVFNYMQLTLISFASRKIFIFALMAIIKQHLFGKEAKECECLQKDKIEKIYYTVYDRVNKALDKLRKIILIQEIPSLIRLLVALIFIVTFGTYFSTFTLLILAFDIYVISNYGTVREKLRNYSTIAIELTSKVISDAIPKYKEEKKD